MKLILGSGSPRRKEILAQAGITPAAIRVLAGDKVQVEMTPYDLSKGRINYRYK